MNNSHEYSNNCLNRFLGHCIPTFFINASSHSEKLFQLWNHSYQYYYFSLLCFFSINQHITNTLTRPLSTGHSISLNRRDTVPHRLYIDKNITTKRNMFFTSCISFINAGPMFFPPIWTHHNYYSTARIVIKY